MLPLLPALGHQEREDTADGRHRHGAVRAVGGLPVTFEVRP
jgi:hypothetical protein